MLKTGSSPTTKDGSSMPDPPRIFLSPPHMSGREQAYIAEVFDTNYIAPVGPHLAKFEQEFAAYVGVKHAVALASGTAALHLALRRLDLQPEDEVLCSTFTFCASANPIIYEGAQPVFIDCDEISWNMDPNLVESELKASAAKGKLPKAIVLVDLLGQSSDIDAIGALAAEYEVPVIEDAAEALGAKYKGRPVGSGCVDNPDWCSTFSFNGNKIITTSGGGMLCSNDEQLIEHARFLSTQARQPGVPHYEHETYGYNYRMSNVLAAIGLAQLEALDDRVAIRHSIFDFYKSHLGDLPGVSFMPEAEFGEPNYWLTSLLIDPDQFGITCEDVRQTMEKSNIEARRVWKPMHQQPTFADCRSVGGAVSEKLFARGLSLPSGTAMTDGDKQRIVDTFQSCVG
jgi:pyridoxal phosphate-dependent aminotransferase EpsN